MFYNISSIFDMFVAVTVGSDAGQDESSEETRGRTYFPCFLPDAGWHRYLSQVLSLSFVFSE